MAALALCADDVAFYPPGVSPFTTARRLHGKAAYLAYLARSTSHYTVVCFSDVHLYPRAKGLAARYLCRWVTVEDTRERQAGTAHFHVAGERIAQIGVRLGPTALQGCRGHGSTAHAGWCLVAARAGD
jgi:hypothetical protein